MFAVGHTNFNVVMKRILTFTFPVISELFEANTINSINSLVQAIYAH